MEAFYLEIRAVHIGAVVISGVLMLLRGLARNAFNASWVTSWPVKSLSYTIDTVLLTAALMLTTIIQQFPFVDGWLTMKVLLLVLYIVLGYSALRGKTLKMRWSSLAGAALIYGFIATIARAHSPLGLFA
ncbi:SirB2 family protein [Sphingomonas sp. NSE70-1]|uniref:SirB2 family protein n=1 Tax=Sphingomonas caseinilyticus TaxID=2908205 RepID=A0ABT0RUF4_9SPHN|nr:SirB2 family protein [Sphingomonas caseinilyticus]MCL6698468.1 SirB2 family protein [Sphingomonas caseinilyticus]